MRGVIAHVGIGLTLALAVGCSRPAATPPGGDPPAPVVPRAEVPASAPDEEKAVRQAVQMSYDTFNSHNWARVPEFASEDWTHINPLGGWTRGREAVLKAVHSTFLKGVTDTQEEMEVRFATPDVAVVTVPSKVSTYTTPDGVKHENERQIRTFVVVKRAGKWLIMQDQNTIRTR